MDRVLIPDSFPEDEFSRIRALHLWPSVCGLLSFSEFTLHISVLLGNSLFYPQPQTPMLTAFQYFLPPSWLLQWIRPRGSFSWTLTGWSSTSPFLLSQFYSCCRYGDRTTGWRFWGLERIPLTHLTASRIWGPVSGGQSARKPVSVLEWPRPHAEDSWGLPQRENAYSVFFPYL